MNDAKLDDAMELHAELFARYIEGQLPPKLAAELEALLGDTPDLKVMQEIAQNAMAEETIASEDDWPRQMHMITGKAFNDHDWLPLPILDNLLTQRSAAAADPTLRYIVDEFPLENGDFQLFWQGETLFLTLTCTDDALWHATAQAWLLSPSLAEGSRPIVHARAELELELAKEGEYKCTAPLPLMSEVSARSQLFVSLLQPAPTLEEVIKYIPGKLRVGHVSVPHERAPLQTAGSRGTSADTEDIQGSLRLLVDKAGLLCTLYWDNLSHTLLLRAELTDDELIDQELQFTVRVDAKPSEPQQDALLQKVRHVFHAREETFAHTFALGAYSYGGADFAFQVLGFQMPFNIEQGIEEAVQWAEHGRLDEMTRCLANVMQLAQKQGDVAAAASLNTAGGRFHKEGNYGVAAAFLETALAIRRTALPAGHSNVATSLNNLGQVYMEQGRYDEAEALQTQALAILAERRTLVDIIVDFEATAGRAIGNFVDAAMTRFRIPTSLQARVGAVSARQFAAAPQPQLSALPSGKPEDEHQPFFYVYTNPIRDECDLGVETLEEERAGEVYLLYIAAPQQDRDGFAGLIALRPTENGAYGVIRVQGEPGKPRFERLAPENITLVDAPVIARYRKLAKTVDPDAVPVWDQWIEQVPEDIRAAIWQEDAALPE